MALEYDGTVRIDSRLDPKGFNSGLKSINASVAKLAGIVGVTFAVGSLIKFGQESVRLGTILKDQVRRFKLIFGDLAATTAAKLDQIALTTYFDPEDLQEWATTFYSTFAGMGIAADQAADLSSRLTEMSLDLATFFAKDPTETVGALKNAMLGRMRGLLEYNIKLDEIMVKEKARNLGLWEGVGALSAQARAEATLALLTEKLAYVQGYAAMSTRTWAGQARLLSIMWEDVKEQVGIGLQAALMGLFPIFQVLLDILTRAATAFAQLMQILFGITIQTSAAGAGLSGAADGAEDLADNTAAAGKAAKGALASFDKLNVLQKDEGGKGIGGLGGIGGMNIPKVEWKQSEGLLTPFFNSLKEVWQAFADWLNGDDTGVKRLWNIFKNTLKAVWDNTIVPFFSDLWLKISGWAASTVITIQTKLGEIWGNITSWAANTVSSIQLKFGTFLSWLQTSILDPFKEKWNAALSSVTTAWETTITGMKTFGKTTFNAIIVFVNALTAAIATGVNTIIDALNKIKISIPAWVPVYGGNTWSLNISKVSPPKIPLLATGAVIPPNSQFAAILGDQRSGKNIEAPESLIRQIVREESQGRTGGEIVIRFEGSLAALVRELKPVIDQENSRIGGSLVSGGASL